jgi:tartrate dehydrogenase/decarboxylase/D-malate dehydrogenase
MMPSDGIRQLSDGDGILLGAVGSPAVDDVTSLWGLLIPIRQEFDQYVNLRPTTTLEGSPHRCPRPVAWTSSSFGRTPRASTRR